MKNFKRVLSITLAVTFLLVIAVIPASARYTDFDAIYIPDELLVAGHFLGENKYVEARTDIISYDLDDTYNCCSSQINVIYKDNTGDVLSVSWGSTTTTATYNTAPIFDSIDEIVTEHYGFYFDDVLNTEAEAYVYFQVSALDIKH